MYNETIRVVIEIILVFYGLVALATAVDTIDAIVTARHIGRPVESAKLRHALGKLCKYMLFLTPFAAADYIIVAIGLAAVPYVSAVMTLAMMGIEAWSMREHAKCRRDKVAKIPHVLKDLAEFVGEDTLREVLTNIAKNKLEKISEE